jgi:hypothetical protein
MRNDPMAHLRAKLDALGELMTRISKGGTTMRPERNTAADSSRRPNRPSPRKGQDKRPESS